MVLSEEQLTDFLNINIEEFATEKFREKKVELFYYFSYCLLHSFLAPCDAVYLHFLADFQVYNTQKYQGELYIHLRVREE